MVWTCQESGAEKIDDDDDVCSVDPAAAPNRFRPKPRVPSLVCHLPRVSYVFLVSQSLKGKMMWVIME